MSQQAELYTVLQAEPYTILMVEDDEILLEFFETVLSDDYQVLVSNSIEQAKDILSNRAVDALFCDLGLGKSSGLELLSWIQFNNPDLLQRTTVLSGERTSRPGGFDVPVVTKPVDAGTLLQLAARATERITVQPSA